MTRNSTLTYMANPPPTARSPRSVMVRAKVVLVSIALVAAVLLMAVASWPLKLLIVIAFVRGLFAADVVAFRNAARVKRTKHAATATDPNDATATQRSDAIEPTAPRPLTWMVDLGVPSITVAKRSAATSDRSWREALAGSRNGIVGIDRSAEDDYCNAGSSP